MRGRGGIAGNPVLIGAATVLVVLVAVFLAYNANQGLPFVPTYTIKARVPNAANLVVGNDVRIGGARVGAVSGIEAERRPDGGLGAHRPACSTPVASVGSTAARVRASQS